MKYIKEYNTQRSNNILNDAVSIITNQIESFEDKFEWVYDYYDERNINYLIQTIVNIKSSEGELLEFDLSNITKKDLRTDGIESYLSKKFIKDDEYFWDMLIEDEIPGKIITVETYFSYGTVYNDNTKEKLNDDTYKYIIDSFNTQKEVVDRLYKLSKDKNVNDLEYYYPKFNFIYTMIYDSNKVNDIFRKLNK